MPGRFDLNDYIDVQQRITRFWTEYPDGAIRTQHVGPIDDFQTCRYRADVYKHRDHPFPDAVGYAFEIAGQGMANKTSHEENAETSAIGRALANMGYATSGKDRPSRQEMIKVTNVPVSASAPRSAPVDQSDLPPYQHPDVYELPPQPPQPAAHRTARRATVPPDQDRPLQSDQDFSGDAQWQAASRTLHATATNVIGKDQAHDTLHIMAEMAGFASLKAVPVKRLLKMNEVMQQDSFGPYFKANILPKLPVPQQQDMEAHP